ncbi:unnamed protein product [Nesidiocoris tenuis]|uniref:Fatty acid desaturase domain-containing protein n=2 Tax=Nesidiocoris tenuis TaxID=355587 RepID=A0A6H5GAZ4_9HEMI|nr:desaturase [Nesidiocoris tenuis]CAA9999810.1 unnamed protein product [Nesidiocoris tenuis]CAA9999812.1 unnamed protein product [Nesidiocoris tenuis]
MTDAEHKPAYKVGVHWLKVLFHIHLHITAAYGLFLAVTSANFTTLLISLGTVFLGMIGLTLGCHRLWAHRMFEAGIGMRAVFAALYTLTCQGSIMDWAMTHRVHHQNHGTVLDPFNYKKGKFYCHMLSHCMETDPDIERKKRHGDKYDLEDDYVVWFQHWFSWVLIPIWGFLLPVNLGLTFGDTLLNSIFVIGFLRVTILLHMSWAVHSAFLIWGLDPKDKNSSETWLVFLITKSLWPQYHYLLPWDYKSGEFGTYDSGVNTAVLKILAVLGLVKKPTTISQKGVKKALADAVSSGKPLQECLNDNRATVDDIIEETQK